MLRQSLGLCALVLVLALGAGCGGDDGGGTKPCQGTPGSPVVFPLDVGNSWTYGRTITDEDGTRSSERIDEVTGVRDFKTDPYSVIRSIVDNGVAQPDTVEQYFSQRAQGLFSFQPVIIVEGPDATDWAVEIVDAINESLPWMIAEFTRTECDSWELLDFSGTWDTSNGQLTIEFNLNASIEQRTTVTVQAGTFSDVYVAKLETRIFQKVRNPFSPVEVEQTETQRMYIKDGVGIVKEVSDIRYIDLLEETPAEVLFEVETNLKSFTLVP